MSLRHLYHIVSISLFDAFGEVEGGRIVVLHGEILLADVRALVEQNPSLAVVSLGAVCSEVRTIDFPALPVAAVPLLGVAARHELVEEGSKSLLCAEDDPLHMVCVAHVAVEVAAPLGVLLAVNQLRPVSVAPACGAGNGHILLAVHEGSNHGLHLVGRVYLCYDVCEILRDERSSKGSVQSVAPVLVLDIP